MLNSSDEREVKISTFPYLQDKIYSVTSDSQLHQFVEAIIAEEEWQSLQDTAKKTKESTSTNNKQKQPSPHTYLQYSISLGKNQSQQCSCRQKKRHSKSIM